MYRKGDLIVYSGEGVCRVEEIGPLHADYARKDVDYYTLFPLYRDGLVFAPVGTKVFMRPILSREEAEALVEKISSVPAEVFENSNPRLLDEHYQAYLKSYDCMDQVKLIRSLYSKKQKAAERGKHLSQVDERGLDRAKKLLHGELAAALGIPLDAVQDYITRKIEGAQSPVGAE